MSAPAPTHQLTDMSHPTRLTVDLSAIQHNVRLIQSHVGPQTAVMAVVKANAYGHGAVRVAQATLAAGARWCGVSSVAEAIELRQAGIRAPILVMGYTPAAWARDAIAHNVHVTLFDRVTAAGFSRAAVALQQPTQAHIKIDTGMGRLGVLPEQATCAINEIAALDGIQVSGLFTHFSSADSDPDYTHEQIRVFAPIVNARPTPRWVHACNSAGTFAYPEAHYTLVRPGIALYGLSPYAPSPAPEPVRALVAQLRPALSFSTQIVLVKTLPDGASVGYGRRYRCQGERTVAVIPVGYGDGFRRTPANAGEVLLHGRRVPILGSVCMDQTMIDVTDVPSTKIGDPVVLIGQQEHERITADDLALRLGTVNYEVVTALLARPRRDYVEAFTEAAIDSPALQDARADPERPVTFRSSRPITFMTEPQTSQRGYLIRPFASLGDHAQCVQVQRQVWVGDDPVPTNMTITLERHGGVAVGAFDADGHMLGFVFSLVVPCPHPDAAGGLCHHSHMAAVLPEWQGRGMGEALKRAQADLVREAGYNLMTWTVDPLEAKNARLNFGKLGCICHTYIENCYGDMHDALNTGLPSDRFEVEWWLGPSPMPKAVGPSISIAIPADFQALKRTDAGAARQWRFDTREQFLRAFSQGLVVTGFTLDAERGTYILHKLDHTGTATHRPAGG